MDLTISDPNPRPLLLFVNTSSMVLRLTRGPQTDTQERLRRVGSPLHNGDKGRTSPSLNETLGTTFPTLSVCVSSQTGVSDTRRGISRVTKVQDLRKEEKKLVQNKEDCVFLNLNRRRTRFPPSPLDAPSPRTQRK